MLRFQCVCMYVCVCVCVSLSLSLSLSLSMDFSVHGVCGQCVGREVYVYLVFSSVWV